MRKLEPAELAETWDAYLDTRDLGERNALVEHYRSLVRYVATKVGARLPAMIDVNDLEAYGYFGLINAIENYDPARGVKFETFARWRIEGSIIDELRKLDNVPRSIRSKVRDVEKARAELNLELGRAPEDAEVATYLGIALEDLWSVATQAHWAVTSGLEEDSEDHPSVAETTFDIGANPEDIFATSEITDLVASAIAGMPDRYKTILVLYYIQGMTLAEIGRVLGVTESRVCQLQSKVLQTLREQLGHGVLAA